MATKSTREAKPGELREIHILETFERLSKRPESRMDLQRMLEKLSPLGKQYAQHLVMSGPSSFNIAAKALGLKAKDIESAVDEIEKNLVLLK